MLSLILISIAVGLKASKTTLLCLIILTYIEIAIEVILTWNDSMITERYRIRTLEEMTRYCVVDSEWNVHDYASTIEDAKKKRKSMMLEDVADGIVNFDYAIFDTVTKKVIKEDK